MTGQTLELLTDENVLLSFEKGICGGICNAIHKYVVANNKYMKNYDSSKPRSYLMYVDANNLYGYAMTKKLPTSNELPTSGKQIFQYLLKNLLKIIVKKVISGICL